MNESQRIEQTSHLTQRLSPRQVQYARLLEMTGPELEEEVRRQLDDNPALEVDDSLNAEEISDGEYLSKDESLDDYREYIDEEDDPADRHPASQYAEYDSPGNWQIASDAPELDAFLRQQADQMIIPDDLKQIVFYIIGNIDENGYLTRSLSQMADDIAIYTGEEVSMNRMREAFDMVRSMDPAGVGAVDLRDCLLLQLNRRAPMTLPLKIAREVISDYFDLFSKKHFDRLAAQLGLEEGSDSLRQAMDIIKTLNPKPGSAMQASDTVQKLSQISPDVIVESLGDSRFAVSLASRLPRLQIERSFSVDKNEGKSANKSQKEALAFIRSKRDDAEAFISALKLRGNTLLSVTEAIVKRQAAFFTTGDISTLSPMILKDISKDTGLDMSVISRATAGKYVATELGTFPLKMFFNEAPNDDSDKSSHEHMQALRRIIEKEDPKHPLSDSEIWSQMKELGYNIARRTISKYRDKMGIPVARLRKKI